MIKILSLAFTLILFFISPASSSKKTIYFEEGEKLFKNNKFLESKFSFEKDIVFNPKSEISYLYLAKIFNKEKNDTLEERNLNTVILLNPQNEEAVFLLALLKIKQSNYNKSEELIENFKKICNILCSKKSELDIKFKNLQSN